MTYTDNRRWKFNSKRGTLQVAFGDHWLELAVMVVASAFGGIALGYIWRGVHIAEALAK